MFKKIRQLAGRYLVNIPGWRTNKKIVVFESDDWGSIRMPSKEAYHNLIGKGIRVDNSIYDTYDTLEQRLDLEFLFNSLIQHRDSKENYPVFTFNTVMGNPDFENIRGDQFKKYYREDFFTSYEVYNEENMTDLWNKAIKENLIFPQFHAREHLNVSLWMDALQKKHKETRVAFNHRYFGLKTNTPSSHQNNYLAAYWPDNERDYQQKLDILEDGLKMFKKKFGYSSESFVACNYIYPKEMEKSLQALGVKYIQTQRGHVSPDINTGRRRIRRHYTGQKTNSNQFYLVRNCFFEPTLEPEIDTISRCLKEIETAFRWRKPAIISSHRVNYVGGLSLENRDNGLCKLDNLLTGILKRWPDVEFMHSAQLGKLMDNSFSE